MHASSPVPAALSLSVNILDLHCGSASLFVEYRREGLPRVFRNYLVMMDQKGLALGHLWPPNIWHRVPTDLLYNQRR